MPKLKFAMILTYFLSFFLVISLTVSGAPRENQVEPIKERGTEDQSVRHPGPTDPAELEAFIDGLMAAHLEAHHIAGATFSFVKDGKLFFAKGYGYADVENREPVAADKSLFCIASISKLFTWTAVMQLCEQGKLDLDTDINTYLKNFKIPETFSEPITLKHLLTHTAGFEDRYKMNAPDLESVVPMSEFLPDNIPARVRAPGEIISYSNHGTTLAGHIVELVSGMPFAEYIEEHIYKPLGMDQSTFRQPFPPGLAPHAAWGYSYASGKFKKGEFEWDLTSPAGGMKTTATDIAKFMIAHLQNGQYNGNRILKEETAQLMHSTLFRHDPRLNGFAHGFEEFDRDGQRIIGHGGDLEQFHSHLALLLDHNAGFFVSYSSPGGTKARDELIEALLDRYYPIPELPKIEPPADFPQRIKKYSGIYRAARHAYTDYTKIGALIMTMSLKDAGDGTLVSKMISMEPQYWVEVEPLFFREKEGTDKLILRQDESGKITHAFLDSIQSMGFYKIPWYQYPNFNIGLTVVCLILFISAIVIWPIRAVRLRMKKAQKAPYLARISQWIVWLISGLFVIATACIGLSMTNIYQFTLGMPPLFKTALWFALLAAILTAIALIFLVIAWIKSYWRLSRRLHFSLVVIAALAFIWFLNQWNLLGLRF